MSVVKLNREMEIDGSKSVPLANIMGTGRSNVDLNTLTKTGIFYCSSISANAPGGRTSYVMVIVLCNSHGGSSDLVQIAIPVGEGGKIYYRRATPGWNDWEILLTDDVKKYTYSNTNIKKGYIYFYKVGRVVYFMSNGDFNASSSSVLPTGVTTYISSISDDLTPIAGEYECSSWNNTGYVFLQVVKESGSSTPKVNVGNYTGTMTSATNGGFHGSYIAMS